MKKSFLVIASLLFLSACQVPYNSPPAGSIQPMPPVPADQNGTPTACTMEYRPVCGNVTIYCITTPCNPVDQTFGNECMAKAAKAYDLREGECPNQN